MNHSQALQSNSEEIKALLEENKDKTKQEVKLLLMKTFKVSDKFENGVNKRDHKYNSKINCNVSKNEDN